MSSRKGERNPWISIASKISPRCRSWQRVPGQPWGSGSASPQQNGSRMDRPEHKIFPLPKLFRHKWVDCLMHVGLTLAAP